MIQVREWHPFTGRESTAVSQARFVARLCYAPCPHVSRVGSLSLAQFAELWVCARQRVVTSLRQHDEESLPRRLALKLGEVCCFVDGVTQGMGAAALRDRITESS